MSRIGKLPINLPKGVSVQVSDKNLVTVKGPKGELTQSVHPDIKVEVLESELKVTRPTDQKMHRSMHGLYRSLLFNMVHGVSEGFTAKLELVGVGYRASGQDQILELSLGYSHNLFFQLPKEITFETKSEKGQNPFITLTSADKQLLGLVCAKIRSYRMPEPYKGKGVKFEGELLRRKAGKSASAK